MVSGLLARSNAARALRLTNRVGLGPRGFPMNADEVMRAIGEVRGAADAGAEAYLELELENEQLRMRLSNVLRGQESLLGRIRRLEASLDLAGQELQRALGSVDG